MRAIQAVLFIVVFTAFYFVMNAYAIGRTARFFGLDMPWLLIILATLSFVLAYFLEMRFSNQCSIAVYSIAGVWMGLVTIHLPVLALYEIFYPLGAPPILLAASPLIAVYALANARSITKVTHFISASITRPLRVLHISDLHLGPVRRRAYIDRLVEMANDARPDIVLVTGDLVDGPGRLPRGMLAPLDEIKAPIYASIGNHERYVGLETVEQLLKGSKIRLLRNEAVRTHGVTLIGVDDSDDGRFLARTLPALDPREGYRILLFHRPQELGTARRHADLMLSGHTHAGQIFPFSLLVRIQFRYLAGLHRIGRMWLHVSPGAGTWGPPMRLGSRSTITLLNLVPA